MIDPRQNTYAVLDADLPNGVTLSARMAVLESRAGLIEGLRAAVSEYDAHLLDTQRLRDVATRRLSVALHSADLLRDIEYSIAPLLGLADRAAPTNPTLDGLSDLTNPLEPATVKSAREPEPVAQPTPAPAPAQVAEMSEPEAHPDLTPTAVTDTLDLVFPTGFELSKQAVVYLDIHAHPGVTLTDIMVRTGLSRGSVSGILTKGVSSLRLSRVGTPGQHRLTASGLSYLRQLHAYAAQSAEGDNAAKSSGDEPEQSMPEVPVVDAATSAPEPVREAAPIKPGQPAPGSAQERALHFLRDHGPATAPVIAAHLGMPPGPAGATIANLVKHGYVTQTDTTPRVIQIPGDTRPVTHAAPTARKAVEAPPAAEPDPVSGVSPITQEELKARVRENAGQVRAVLGKKPMTELDLRARLPDMNLSHLRAALGHLEEAGTVRRVPGPTPASRAAYALDELELPAPQRAHLTAEGRMVEAHLTQVTDRSERDTVSNMSLKLGLPRADVEEALAVLHAQGRLRWSRTGMLLHFTLATASTAEVAA
ncbi:helix-turn-helix domain-containing protein [Deinococcus sp. LM3]|uniref:MarR family transcriptional regulator n=1 Tax=Deinococcus sp. LM3 TaxID=1938608 RepID=UPI000991A685|nr:helix-turn-helix domain-containing protein [Deinococcus sp. LM3]OOV11337.1 hypothetical protein BXU09_19925 [Deinococcus sp. LM3]